MPATLATFDPFLKDVYGPYLEKEGFNDADAILPLFQDGSANAEWDGNGRQWRVAVLLQHAYSGMAIGEGSFLPEGGSSVAGNLLVPQRFVHSAVELSAQVMNLTEGPNAAFANGLRVEMESMMASNRKMMTRIAWGDGKGAIAQVNGAVLVGATTVNVDNPALLVGAIGGNRYIFPGMKLAVLDPTDTTFVTTLNVTAVSATGTSITVTATTVAIADNSILYLSNTTGTFTSIAQNSNKNYEPVGLRGLINDAVGTPTYFGLSRSLFPNIASTNVAIGGAIDDATLQTQFNRVQMLGMTDSIDPGEVKMICEPAVRGALVTLQQLLRRYTGEALMNPDGGTRAVTNRSNLTYGGVEIIASHNAPYGELLILNTSGLQKVVRLEGWASETGAIWKQVVQSGGRLDRYVADYRKWCNFFHRNPKNSVRLTGITANTVFFPVF